MSRPLRITYPGALYHITARGNRKGDIFLDDRDRLVFLEKLATVIKHHNWICHAYCLMGNHYHLLIETVEANLSEGMRDLNKDYSQAFNRLHKTVGHLLQGRFKSFIIEKEPYLLEVARYTVLNPVRANLVDHPALWRWSSFSATAGLVDAPTFLTTDWLLTHFSEDHAQAQRPYIEFVMSGIDGRSPFDEASHRSILGSPQFVSEMWEQCKDSSTIMEIPREERIVGRPGLVDLFPREQTRVERDMTIAFARMGCGYSVAEIARFVGLSQASVSEISRK
ncbi:MAG TPA: transposase [Patescibacteria group bacterium]|nr:transposase [Patescibacteria group bacterium]